MKSYNEKLEALNDIIRDLDADTLVYLNNSCCQYYKQYDNYIYNLSEFNSIVDGDPLSIAKQIYYGDFDPHLSYWHYDKYNHIESIEDPLFYMDIEKIAKDIIDTEESFRCRAIQKEIDTWEDDEE